MWNGRHRIHDRSDVVMKVIEFPADFCNKERTRQEIIEIC
jgi:hypothetical protein